MPFHRHNRSSSSVNLGNASSGAPGAFSGVIQASQLLGSVGAPSASVLPDQSRSSGAPAPEADPGPAMADSFDGPRRVPTFPRQPEELHIPGGNTLPPQNGPRPGPSQFPSAPEFGASLPPSISIQHSAAQAGQYPAGSNAGSALPGTLQPGHMNRLSGNPAPSLPTLPQLSTQTHQPSPPSKSIPQSRGYSKSSPAGFEQQQMYKNAGSTPDSGKYISPSSMGFGIQTPQSTPYSPLGLSDIRPLMDSVDDTLSPIGQNNGGLQFPTNSNYLAPWGVYALDWCKWPTRPNSPSAGKVALGSYLEDHHNYIHILHAQQAQPDRDHPDPDWEPGLEFIKTAEATHSYPVTRILWEPPSSQKQGSDLLATSGDHLRLWSLPSESSLSQYHGGNSITRGHAKGTPVQKLSPLALLSNSKTPEHTAPITSLDWNVVSPSLIITSSIDTTCTIWDIPTLTAKTQLIAHDKEVYDVRFCANSVDVFVSCGADGSVRMFDLRSLEHSTIIYEPSEKTEKRPTADSQPANLNAGPWPPPLLRIATSPHDAHLLGTFAQDSNIVRILDVRQPGQALLELKGHSAPINCIEWSPTHRGTLASGADDCLVLIWDLINQGNAAPLPPQSAGTITQAQPHHHGATGAPTTMERGPAAAWRCDYEVSNISWAPRLSVSSNISENWLGVCGGRGLWGVSI